MDGHPQRRWAWLAVLAGVLLYVLVLTAVAGTGNPIFVPSLILIGAAIFPAAFLTLAAGRTARWTVSDRSSPPPPW